MSNNERNLNYITCVSLTTKFGRRLLKGSVVNMLGTIFYFTKSSPDNLTCVSLSEEAIR